MFGVDVRYIKSKMWDIKTWKMCELVPYSIYNPIFSEENFTRTLL